jgi:quinoprotein glucose dehydrogenase
MEGIMDKANSPAIAARVLGLVLLLAGLPMAWWGGQLAGLGGSAYYVLAGLALIASGVLLLRKKANGVSLYLIVLLATLAWAIAEAGIGFWPLLPRIGGPLVLGAILALPLVRRPLEGEVRPGLKTFAIGAVLAVLAGLGLNRIADPLPPRPINRTGSTTAPTPVKADVAETGDWLNYGNDLGGSRFSTLAQITPANAGKLELAWTFRTGADKTGEMPPLEANPLKIGDTVYVCTAYNDVIALDAESGAQKWRYRSGNDMSRSPYGQCRGLGYYKAEGRAICPERILTNTIDARLVAIDAKTGKPCADFGTNGSVDLMEGMGKWPDGYYYPTSAPTIVRGKAVLNAWVWDNQHKNEPSGVIRAFDVLTGKLAWAFDVAHPERSGLPPKGETYTMGTPSSWSPKSADEELGLVYIPMGNATPDFYAAQRPKEYEYINASVVAIDAETGRVRWTFQTMHNDIWDMDNPAQPTLADIRTKDGIKKALIQPTKRGEFFVLDRVTGKPIKPVTEVAVPVKNALPGEKLSPTQPFSLAMPSTRIPTLVERTMWGISPLDQLWCRLEFRKMRYEGPYTPFGLGWTLMTPSTTGANNWGGIAVDKDRNLLIANAMHLAGRIRMIPRKQADAEGIKPGQTTGADGHITNVSAQMGLPYAAQPEAAWMSPLGIPCTQPPFGTMNAIDLSSGKLVWSKPLGVASESGPWGLRSGLPLTIGTPNIGGPVATRGGVTFMAGTQDRMIRAFDSATGKEVWSYRLPTGAMATPSTYWSEKSGRQFVVIAVSGHKYIRSPAGDYIMAFALPKGAK